MALVLKNAQILSTLIRINSSVTLAITHVLNVILILLMDVKLVLRENSLRFLSKKKKKIKYILKLKKYLKKIDRLQIKFIKSKII
jgi:hypothetical protein